MERPRPSWLREIDHTGDVGIVVTAPTLCDLYARAALGMFWVLTDLDAVRETDTRTVAVEAADREALMVRWLSDLNFVHVTEHQLFRRIEVDALKPTADGVALRATCAGESIDPARHTVYTEIKAVTFHGLQIRDTGDGWTVQVIFDL